MRKNPHDRFFRIAFANAQDTAEWLRRVLPADLAAVIDWSCLRILSGDLPDEGSGATRGDLTFATTLLGCPVVVIIPLEHQRGAERWMDLRMVGYALQGARAWQREHPRDPTLPAILAVVVYQGSRPWTAPLDLRDRVPLPPAAASVLAPYLVGQRYILLDLARRPDLCEVGPPSLRIATRLLAHAGGSGRAELLRAHWGDLKAAVGARGSPFRDAVRQYTAR